MTRSPTAYLAEIKLLFEELADPEVAEQQSKYMRFKFVYYGMKAPVWVPVCKAFFKENGLFTGSELVDFAHLCYEEDYRETHYLGLQMVEKALKKQDEDFIFTLEHLITENSWWDTVDWLAKLVGIHLLRYPQLTAPIAAKWIQSDNFWLQRCAIIFQLAYKEKTNEQLLFNNILQVADSSEFFLQKAAGWALRQYSRTQPAAVKAFIQNHTLAPLTIREGARIMKKHGTW